MNGNKSDILLRKMKEDWDDRIKLHHRFWMGDVVDSDEEMWKSGERDLMILLEGLESDNFNTWKVLEYGCGVGRLLKPSSEVFGQVYGVDVSEVAIDNARSLLSECLNVFLGLTNGSDLREYETNSFDSAFSFACLNHVPVAILPRILLELHRVVKVGGPVVLQLYVGAVPSVDQQDTIVIRGYPEEFLVKAFTHIGFFVQNIRPLQLPFDAKDHERNLVPHIFTLIKQNPSLVAFDDLAVILNPNGEKDSGMEWKGSHFEYRLAATLLEQQAKNGKIQEAIDTLSFALEKYKDPDPGAIELLDKLKAML